MIENYQYRHIKILKKIMDYKENGDEYLIKY